ncbi:MAG: hypothetical protein ACHQ5A_00280 [Opitutales bacterium]
MSDFGANPTPPAEIQASARRLSSMGLVVLFVGALLFWISSPWQSVTVNFLTIGICTAGLLPVLLWLRRQDPSYPLPEVLQLTLIPFYAVPLLSEHEAVARYPEDVIGTAAFLVLVFQISCHLGSLLANRTFHQPRLTPLWSDELVSDDNLRFSIYTLMAATGWLFFISFTDIVPRELMGTLRAVFFGIGTLSTFVLARLWGSGHLTRSQKAIFVVNVVLQILLASLGLLLVTGIIIFLLTLVGYFSSARRIPWVVCALALPIFAILHNGKYQMREIHWGEYSQRVGILEVPRYYAEWVGYGLQGSGDREKQGRTGTNSNLFQRASLTQIVCYAVETVPDRTPYFDGATYSYVLPQILPRFLWPDKPSPNDSVKMLSIRLGLLTADEADNTSIGFGLITESYVNFGIYGTAALGLVFGWALRRIALGTAACNTLSVGGIFRILCLAWCLNTETTLAVWLSSLYQACISIFVPLLLLRSFFR